MIYIYMLLLGYKPVLISICHDHNSNQQCTWISSWLYHGGLQAGKRNMFFSDFQSDFVLSAHYYHLQSKNIKMLRKKSMFLVTSIKSQKIWLDSGLIKILFFVIFWFFPGATFCAILGKVSKIEWAVSLSLFIVLALLDFLQN